ncbi:MFS transporter [Cupriavidus sp. 30B13]|uniref:MFS transporter n=1 Tax=Cupriavidus sp. 30B13 TaxID=3384241 RepID=UPI003B8EF72F
MTIPDQAQRGAPGQPGSGARMWAAAWIVATVFMLSNTPTPLYVHWQQRMGFSSGMLTVIFAAYVAGMLLTLLVAGQVSDRHGRRVVLAPGMAAAIVACALFATASSVAALVVARLLTGMAVAAAVSAGISAVAEQGGPARERQASLAASVAMVTGAALGPMLAGVIGFLAVDTVPWVFAVAGALVASALLLVCVLPLAGAGAGKLSAPAPAPAAAFRLRLPTVAPEYRRFLAWGIAVYAPALAGAAFVLSLAPSLLAALRGTHDPLIAGGMVCAMFVAATVIQFPVRGLAVRTMLLAGALATVAAVSCLALAAYLEMAPLVIAAALLMGTALGLGQLGGLTLIGTHVPDAQRAEANAALNMAGYFPAGLLPVATGYLVDVVGIHAGAAVFAAVLGGAALLGAGFVARTLPGGGAAAPRVTAPVH